MTHNTSNTRKSWEQRGREGFSVGPALQHYRCIQAIVGKIKVLIITDTAEYFHIYLTQPHITAEDRMTYTIQFLAAALKDVPAIICNSQLAEIDAVREIFSNGTIKPLQNETASAPLMEKHAKSERCRLPTSKGDREIKPATTSKGALKEPVRKLKKIKNITINTVDDPEPISRRTRSRN